MFAIYSYNDVEKRGSLDYLDDFLTPRFQSNSSVIVVVILLMGLNGDKFGLSMGATPDCLSK